MVLVDLGVSREDRLKKSRWLTGILLVCIAILSQGVHDIAIEHLGVPYPTLVTPPSWLPVLADTERVVFLVLFCWAAKERLDRLPPVAAAALVGLFTVCLAENTRVSVINFILANDWSSRHWLFAAIDLPTYMISGLLLGSLAFLISKFRFPRWRPVAVLLAAIGAAALVRLAVVPAAKEGSALLLGLANVSSPPEFYQPPYGPGILGVIYLTFIEPVIASFVMAKWSWHDLPSGKVLRIFAFVALILGARGRLTFLLMNSLWVQQPAVWAFLSTGEFFAETAVMAALVALLLAWRNAGDGSPARPVDR